MTSLQAKVTLTGSLFVCAVMSVESVRAQDTRGFVTLQIDRSTAAQEGWLPIVSLGATKDLLGRRVSVGGQGDLAIWPGMGIAVRLGPIAQLNLVQRPNIRTFAIGGYMLGFERGWRAGAGVELLPVARRAGLRVGPTISHREFEGVVTGDRCRDEVARGIDEN